MDKKKLLSMVAIFIVAFGGGFWANEAINKNVSITSLKNRQEVHSVVVVDASTWEADEVEVLINGKKVANYLPYKWNNMLEPVGEYDITVRVKSGGTWTEDTKTVVIPEEFTVPSNYTFDEDFVVHEGQTVTFEDGTWNLERGTYSNGVTPENEKTYYAINVFGDIIIENANIVSATVCVEENGTMTFKGDSHISIKKDIESKNFGIHSKRIVRFDDYSKLYVDNAIDLNEIPEKYAYYQKGGTKFVLIEQAYIYWLDGTLYDNNGERD